jgi:hypothetical protein
MAAPAVQRSKLHVLTRHLSDEKVANCAPSRLTSRLCTRALAFASAYRSVSSLELKLTSASGKACPLLLQYSMMPVRAQRTAALASPACAYRLACQAPAAANLRTHA